MATWMIVEDEADLYEMLLTMIKLLGHDGLAFSAGEEAAKWIDKVASGQFEGELPVVALVDIRLPGQVSGLDVAASIRARLPTKAGEKPMKIILMTAYKLTRTQVEEAIQLSGADLLLYKPLPPIAKLQEILDGVVA